MKSNRMLVAVMTIFGLLASYLASQAEAGDTAKTISNVQAVADAIKAGKKGDDLKKLAGSAVKDLEEVMHLFAPRAKGGFGFGPKATEKLDGIEVRLRDLDRSGLKAADLENIANMAYQIRAIAEVTTHHAPKKDMGAKKVKDFVQWNNDMTAAAEALNKAAADKDLIKGKEAVKKLNAICATCHGVWRN